MDITFKPSGDNLHQIQRSIFEFISEMISDDVDTVTASAQIIASLMDVREFTSYDISDVVELDVYETYQVGYLDINDRSLVLEVDPNLKWNDLHLFIGNTVVTIELERGILI